MNCDFEEIDEQLLNETCLFEETARCETEPDINTINTKMTAKPSPKSNAFPPASEDHLRILLAKFGHVRFRPLQWDVIYSIAEKHEDNLVVMATGYGKSLCYQYPSVYRNGLSIVISPLVSLMEDQTHSLEVYGIPACLLGSAQSKEREVIKNLLDNKYRILYLTPEYASGDTGLNLLKDLKEKVSITLIAIDEAHCVSTWGHDFRPAYRHLSTLRNMLPSVPILAVTATATETVKQDIIKSLRLKNPRISCTGFDRPNLFFKALPKVDNCKDILSILLREGGQYDIKNGSVIIYCLTKKATEEITLVLNKQNIKAANYHAGLSMGKRKEVYEMFVKDKIKIIVATIAFGMGINKPDVRCVINYGASSSIENYYQEAGRAGRDGNPALCVLFHSPSDFVTHRFLQNELPAAVKKRKEILNMKMQDYVSSTECRRHMIISYFDSTFKIPEKPDPNCCDNCTRRLESVDCKYLDQNGCYNFTEDAKFFLMAIKTVKPNTFGIQKIVSVLRGTNSKMFNPKVTQSSTFGIGVKKKDVWWKDICFILQKELYVEKNLVGPMSVPVLDITLKGEKYLHDLERGTAKPLCLVPTQNLLAYLKEMHHKNHKGTNSTVNEASTSRLVVSTQSKYEEDLSKLLYNLRQVIANELDSAPYTVASDNAIRQLALKKPMSLETLQDAHIDGFTEAKISKFGHRWINVIQRHVHKNPMPIDTLEEIISRNDLPLSTNTCFSLLSNTHRVSLDMFNEGNSIADIASKRNFAISTIGNHISSGIRQGVNVNMNRVLSASTLNTIIKVVESKVINKDMNKLAPIKELCPPHITYEDIKMAVAYISARYHIKSLGLPYKDSYALFYDGKNYSYKSEMVTPEQKNLCIQRSTGSAALASENKSCDTSNEEMDVSMQSEPCKDEICSDNLNETNLSLGWDDDDDALLSHMTELEQQCEKLKNDNTIPVSSNEDFNCDLISKTSLKRSIQNVAAMKKKVKKNTLFN